VNEVSVSKITRKHSSYKIIPENLLHKQQQENQLQKRNLAKVGECDSHTCHLRYLKDGIFNKTF
jgi:hypothetical protein